VFSHKNLYGLEGAPTPEHELFDWRKTATPSKRIRIDNTSWMDIYPHSG